jgi:hypothetical protein
MTSREKLAEAVLAVAALSDKAQEVIADEMLIRASDFSVSQLSAEQRTEVKRRLAQPRTYVPDSKVRALFRRYRA